MKFKLFTFLTIISISVAASFSKFNRIPFENKTSKRINKDTYHRLVTIDNVEKAYYKQRGDFWCWAAVVESLDKYYNKKNLRTQEKIIKEMFRLPYLTPDAYLSPRLSLKENRHYEWKNKYLSEYTFITKNNVLKYIKHYKKPVLATFDNHTSLIIGVEVNERTNEKYFVLVNTRISDKNKIIRYPIKHMNYHTINFKSAFLVKF